MDARTRARLLGAASPSAGEAWGDLGCGSGAFTVPLLDAVGGDGYVLAIDRDRDALLALRRTIAQRAKGGRVELRLADVAMPGDLPPLDGLLLANVLHYLPDPGATLGTLRRALPRGARLLVIEYDRRDATPWVPFPLPIDRLSRLATDAGLSPFEVRETARSDFGAGVYAALSTVP